MNQPTGHPRLLFVVSEDWYFHSHRLPLAQAAIAAGFEVTLATRVGEHAEAITRAGIRVRPLGMQRRSVNPLRELLTLLELRRIVAEERPDIVHNVAIKPVLYGSIAARFAGRPKVVNTIAGMGYLFTSLNLRARVLRPVIEFALKMFLDNPSSRLIVQNPEDLQFLTRNGIVRSERVALIRGSGVDTRTFAPAAEPQNAPPVVMLASRMIRDKGIPEFAEAARMLRDEGIAARFVLVGAPDPQNPASMSENELRSLRERHGVEWWGSQGDMPAVLAAASIVCLPTTYGEGVPKVLLEAASCGRAIVATDVQGCREIVIDEVNGLLVPPSDAIAFATAIRRLLRDPDLRKRMGTRGRALVEDQFGIDKVTAATLSLYRNLLSDVAA